MEVARNLEFDPKDTFFLDGKSSGYYGYPANTGAPPIANSYSLLGVIYGTRSRLFLAGSVAAALARSSL